LGGEQPFTQYASEWYRLTLLPDAVRRGVLAILNESIESRLCLGLIGKGPNGHPSSPILVTSLKNESAASARRLGGLLTPQPGSEQLF
jgi:hypothetical protein